MNKILRFFFLPIILLKTIKRRYQILYKQIPWYSILHNINYRKNVSSDYMYVISRIMLKIQSFPINSTLVELSIFIKIFFFWSFIQISEPEVLNHVNKLYGWYIDNNSEFSNFYHTCNARWAYYIYHQNIFLTIYTNLRDWSFEIID